MHAAIKTILRLRRWGELPLALLLILINSILFLQGHLQGHSHYLQGHFPPPLHSFSPKKSCKKLLLTP